MIAGDRYAAHNRLGLTGRRYLAVFQLVANDLVVDLRVEPIFVEPDTGAAMRALREGRTEADIDVSLARAFRILESDQKTTLVRGVIAVIDATPGVDIDSAVGRHCELSGVTDFVGKYCRAESAGKAQSGFTLRAFLLCAERRNSPAQAQPGRYETKPAFTHPLSRFVIARAPYLPTPRS